MQSDTLQAVKMIAKELRDDPKRAEEMGLTEDEVAFYDALASSESALQILGDAKLRAIARDLVKSVLEDATIDWNLREGVKASIRLKIKKLLKKYGYPQETTDKATDQVLE